MLRLLPILISLYQLLIVMGMANGEGSHITELSGKVIVLDPGHGDTAAEDAYRVGPSGEREEWINLRVALILRDKLEEAGATVLMTRDEDTHVELTERAALATENNADLFLSVHHNAIGDPDANFPIVYFHGYASENEAGVRLSTLMADELRNGLFDGEGPAVVASDYTIFPTAGTAVLRHSYGIPGVITEASFFTNPEEEKRLKNPEYNRLEARHLFKAIVRFFENPLPPIYEKNSRTEPDPFPVAQEAGRMDERAQRWKFNYEEARRLFEDGGENALVRALELAEESIRYFPDSYIARDAHLLRAEILEKLGRPMDAVNARQRVRELYPECC